MFTSVLIANRGAIACRIGRTLRDMGVRSVAVYSEADRGALHVAQADAAVCIGPAAARDSYLSAERIIEAARATGAEAVHPGYGFLAENADFAERCAEAGLVFLGPTPAQMRQFGLKHAARALAVATQVPLLPGSGLLDGLAHAQQEAERIGYPLMLKSSAGGGGIGLQRCTTPDALAQAYDTVRRLAVANFADCGLFLERYIADARHIEVQIFGDGQGGVLALGERDCSVQRRNQKVIEETPAPHLRADVRDALLATATRLMRAAAYRSAGTVEFIVDARTQDAYFLEVNARLQVEHGITEAVTGVDLVEWMVRLGCGELPPLDTLRCTPKGHAIEVRLYAEDPSKDDRPCTGTLTEVRWPATVRVDTWVERGTEITPHYDPMLAKLIALGSDRAAALRTMAAALRATRIGGLESNLERLRDVLAQPAFVEGVYTTRTLAGLPVTGRAIDVLQPGVHTTVQDWPGRGGLWAVGVPPSGPMDDRALRLANRLVGNVQGAAGLEITVAGPTLRFRCDATVAVCGAPLPLQLDGRSVPMNVALSVDAGQTLAIGRVQAGLRACLAVRGAIDVPLYLGSAATFTLGGFGGHAGRTLRAADVLHIGMAPDARSESGCGPAQADAGIGLLPGESLLSPLSPLPASAAAALVGEVLRHWTIGVLLGPHAAPDFFTEADIAMLLATHWRVHYNSSRTGVRLDGPKPAFARRDGGEAGLHPSNIHDNAYAIGAIDFTGDMPVILGPDGPSLGGFVCPAVVVQAELWKVGQLAPGDTLQFQAMRLPAALAAEAAFAAALLGRAVAASGAHGGTADPVATLHDRSDAAAETPAPEAAVLLCSPADGPRPALVVRRAGDRSVLVEFGPPVLDLRLRFMEHALMRELQSDVDADTAADAAAADTATDADTARADTARADTARADTDADTARADTEAQPGILEMTPGIRSVQLRYDPRRLPLGTLLQRLQSAWRRVGSVDDIEVPSRTVWLPLSWDDPATQLATARYMQSVRADAPWCPDNIEFIRRINGLPDADAVRQIVFSAEYMVLGLGDVYLGAPVATPLDPRHRLVTTKYNPARTWTPENAVGIGGAYLCVYGMEGPGGYQFVGRTVQMWNKWHDGTAPSSGHASALDGAPGDALGDTPKDAPNDAPADAPSQPWLLHFFDRIRFYPVSADELLALRRDVPAGRARLRIQPGRFRLADHLQLLQSEASSIAAFKATQQAAFDAERERWGVAGLAEGAAGAPAADVSMGQDEAEATGTPIASEVSGCVWAVLVEPGAEVAAGQTLLVVESMKMEVAVVAPHAGRVGHLLCAPGRAVTAGQALVTLV